MLSYKKKNKIPEGSKNIILLTGSGLKDIQSVQASLDIPEAIEPDIHSIDKLLNSYDPF